MSDNTKIEWVRDGDGRPGATVNAVNGCSVTSPGCTNCYAMKQAHRFPARAGLTTKTNGGMVWTGEVRFNEKQLLLPLGWKRPRRIFWNAHGDLFHPAVPDEWIDRVFAVCALTPQHTHMILTKRSGRMLEYVRSLDQAVIKAFSPPHQHPALDDRHAEFFAIIAPNSIAEWPLPNVWLGVSVEDQARADQRIPDLLATPAAVRFISAEPLLGPVDLTFLDYEAGTVLIDALTGRHGIMVPLQGEGPKLDWVICGGESGPGARPMHPDWARALRDQCAAAGTAFHFKQWGEWFPGEMDNASDGTGWRAYPDEDHDPTAADWTGRWKYTAGMLRIGKKRAGRLLDGIEHNGLPGQPHA